MNDPWTHHFREVNGFNMHYVTAGSGMPLLLVHGWPQSWYEWRHVIPALAERFLVIAPDLRGLGDSERPDTGYDKRTLGDDLRALLNGLGHERAYVIGHDWGATATYYLAYDNPELVGRLLIFDGIPGLFRTGQSFDLGYARSLFHVFFHAAMPDVAERLIGSDVRAYLSHFFRSPVYNHRPDVFSERDIDEYVRVHSAPGALRAGIRYYTTAVAEDVVNFTAATHKLPMPVQVWGATAETNTEHGLLASWRTVADRADGGAVAECGHFVAEERPDFVIEKALAFFAGSEAGQ